MEGGGRGGGGGGGGGGKGGLLHTKALQDNSESSCTSTPERQGTHNCFNYGTECVPLESQEVNEMLIWSGHACHVLVFSQETHLFPLVLVAAVRVPSRRP